MLEVISPGTLSAMRYTVKTRDMSLLDLLDLLFEPVLRYATLSSELVLGPWLRFSHQSSQGHDTHSKAHTIHPAARRPEGSGHHATRSGLSGLSMDGPLEMAR